MLVKAVFMPEKAIHTLVKAIQVSVNGSITEVCIPCKPWLPMVLFTKERSRPNTDLGEGLHDPKLFNKTRRNHMSYFDTTYHD